MDEEVMNYDINTDEGMANAIQWVEQLLAACRTDVLFWAVPRSGALYTIEKSTKIFSANPGEDATDRVLVAMGYTKKVLQ